MGGLMFLLVFGVCWGLLMGINWFGLLRVIGYVWSLLVSDRCYLLILGDVLFMNKLRTEGVGLFFS